MQVGGWTSYIVLIALAVGSFALDFKRVHLVDHVLQSPSGKPNFLFRGNMPTNATAFAVDELLSFMSQRALQEGNISFPIDTKLIVISLNNVFDESKRSSDFRKEVDFWKDPQNSIYGSFVNWPLGVAGLAPPSAFSESAWRIMLKALVWDIDQLPKRVEIIRGMLTASYNSSVAIYVHCTAGCDRTGEVIGAYMLEYLVPNISLAYALDVSECGRPPNYFSTSALEWFCLYHEQQQGRDGKVPCTSFAKCKTFGDCQPTDSFVESGAFGDDDEAMSVLAAHVNSQNALGSAGTPVLQFDRRVQASVAEDDAMLPQLLGAR